MATWRCNSCLATYTGQEDGGGCHVCPAYVIVKHAVCDPVTGVIVEPEVRAPRAQIRDERPEAGACCLNGKAGYMRPLPDDPANMHFAAGPHVPRLEGLGRTLVQD